HLAELKLPAAAEALPAVLDQAIAEGLSLTVALEPLLGSRDRGQRPPGRARSRLPWRGCWPSKSRQAPPGGWPGGCGSPACPPQPPWPTSTSTPPPASTASLSKSWGTGRTVN